ncbi:tol-pal system protein YbgF [Bartonella tamiae]|uniref:Cell division coordinator CpoB n=1 Tax=Bartonella tamiae Th239 TaxID=1094558 RepID=J0QZX3_9HYPH|nr:tol-pal system protein YbgF [Bartonella tamiae]EJF91731.1 tol-pal system protein YbgF [Bartonella tamiae Th239]EJF92601.1 tol-pal system protein YbgF [Bartonella tamiae Th307]
MDLGQRSKFVNRSFQKTLLATVLVPTLTLTALLPARSAPIRSQILSHIAEDFPLSNRMSGLSKKIQYAPSHNGQGNEGRISDLEQKVRELTGKVEELNFMVLQMQEEMRQLSHTPSDDNVAPIVQQPQTEDKHSSQNASRMNALPGVDIGQNQSSSEQKLPANEDKIHFDKDGNILKADNPPPQTQSPPQGGNMLTTVPETSTSKELYDIGYRHILAGDYRAAESVFRTFQERYPSDPMIGDASFWLGESLYGQKRYREAAQAFIDVQRNYKDSPRGPENLLKLGMTMSELKEEKVACATFAEVSKRYDNVEPAVLKRVKDEQSRNKCQ